MRVGLLCPVRLLLAQALRPLAAVLLVLPLLLAPGLAGAQPNGQLDSPADLVTRLRVGVPMADGVELATDVYLPVLSDDLAFDSLSFNILGGRLSVPRLVFATRGTPWIAPTSADSSFPLVFVRTPYGMGRDSILGTAMATLGYAFAAQDMRGRYASQGTYLPMYSDGWAKAPYMGPGQGHRLDTTANKAGNTHTDGADALQHLLANLRWDGNQDGQITAQDPLVCDGRVGMFGASAMGNSQYQLAGSLPTSPGAPGLKALFPAVAAAEFWATAGHPNGLYRQGLISGWLRQQVADYPYAPSAGDTSVQNGIHSLADYGPGITTDSLAGEAAVDAWTQVLAAHYPGSPLRAAMDMSQAPINPTTGQGQPGGSSRYRHLDVPIYNLTGWYDIFIEGQIETWQLGRAHAPNPNRRRQKLVVGPWAHQTIGNRETGDRRGADAYPPNVTEVLGISLNDLENSDPGAVARSELYAWFRQFLGEPNVQLLPATDWTPATLDTLALGLRMPADTVRIPFATFFNYMNGTGPLPGMPVRVRGFPGIDSNQVLPLTLPQTDTSLLGDTLGTTLTAALPLNFDDGDADGVPAVRLYVTAAPTDTALGHYWLAADTFPLPTTTPLALYLHPGGRADTAPPTQPDTLRYYSDPFAPVPTHGGGNMLLQTPDGRLNQGQMDYSAPTVANRFANPPRRAFGADSLADVLSFTTDPLTDSLALVGYPQVALQGALAPQGNGPAGLANGDWVVRLLEVDPNGRIWYLTEGGVNARAAAWAAARATGQPTAGISYTNPAAGAWVGYRFNLSPLAHTVAPGNRLRVVLSGSSYPRYQSCPNLPLDADSFFRFEPTQTAATFRYQGTAYAPQVNVASLALGSGGAQLLLPVFDGSTLSRHASHPTANPAPPALQVWPNPATNQLQLHWPDAAPQARLRVLDALGRVVWAGTAQRGQDLNVGSWPRGLLMLERQDGPGGQARVLLR